MRLIDADELILRLETQDYSGAPDTLEDWTPQDMTRAEIADIGKTPTIDAVPVVRCKDCKHSKQRFMEYERPGMVFCPHTCGGWVAEDWFCADGERRSDA